MSGNPEEEFELVMRRVGRAKEREDSQGVPFNFFIREVNHVYSDI
jgi:hypothetical protein